MPVLAFQRGPGLRPDRLLNDGDEIAVGSVRVTVLHTPGHSPDHLCYCAGTVVFTGDHVINGDSALVEHVPEYLESLEHLNSCGPRVMFPGHGNPMRDPNTVITVQVAGIRDRESRILAALDAGARTVGEVVERVYPGLDRALYFSTAENVGAHLRKLSSDGLVALPEGAVEWSAHVNLVRSGPEEA